MLLWHLTRERWLSTVCLWNLLCLTSLHELTNQQVLQAELVLVSVVWYINTGTTRANPDTRYWRWIYNDSIFKPRKKKGGNYNTQTKISVRGIERNWTRRLRCLWHQWTSQKITCRHRQDNCTKQQNLPELLVYHKLTWSHSWCRKKHC